MLMLLPVHYEGHTSFVHHNAYIESSYMINNQLDYQLPSK